MELASRICLIAKFGAKIKIFKFKTKDVVTHEILTDKGF